MKTKSKMWGTCLALPGLVITASLSVGCENNAKTNALIGAGVGAVLGQALGGSTEATLIGAGVGAAGGYAIGNEQDKNEADGR